MTELSEQETRTRYITPAIQRAGWQARQIREEIYFTDGRIIVRGKMAMRGSAKKADYFLYHSANLPIAIIEAKKHSLGVGAGLQQALYYGDETGRPADHRTCRIFIESIVDAILDDMVQLAQDEHQPDTDGTPETLTLETNCRPWNRPGERSYPQADGQYGILLP